MAPLDVDLLALTEIAQRIGSHGKGSRQDFETLHPVLSLFSHLNKAPIVPPGTLAVNALSKQRNCMISISCACVEP